MKKHELESRSGQPFDLQVSNPKSTNLLAFTSVSLEEDLAETKELHETLIKQVIADQEQAIKIEKDKLITQIEQTTFFLEQAKLMAENAETALQITATAEQVINFTTRLFSLNEKLEDLTAGKVERYVVEGERAKLKKLSGSLILALGIVLGGILGIMAAFFAEFAAQVRQSLQEENQAKI